MDYRKRLIEVHQKFYEEEKTLIERSLDQSLLQNHVRVEFFYLNEDEALYQYSVEGNIEVAKQHFYTCGRCDEYMIKTYDYQRLSAGIRHIGYALLSDCKPLIERYALLNDSAFEVQKRKGHPVYCVQLALLNKLDELEKQVALLGEKASKKTNKWLLPDVGFFEGLLAADEGLMVESLMQLLKPRLHNKYNAFFILQKDILSFPAVTYAKLAALKGYDLAIEHDLVPKDLITVKPNPVYTDPYHFLKENG
ncbi:Imm49 family immunity protein [uncultured Roseivirga sp.]|uniref:Imm49 family immunity protein n=1 Tax=uncultured Roseivirga sp. TaxID=543088 RepID=UPI002582B031|nr:Imm49 family immunity protein [uncultured Roseivirga sp.]